MECYSPCIVLVLICIGVTSKNNELYQLKVDVGMLNTVKNYLADVQVLALRQSQKTKKKVYHSANR